jgi:ATP-dependent Lon protease
MEKIKLPLIPLRNMVVFPHMVTHFDCGRDISINAIEEAEMADSKIFLVAQIDFAVESPEEDDLYEVGTIASIKQILKLPGGVVRVLVEGETRAEIKNLEMGESFINAEISPYEEDTAKYNESENLEAALRLAVSDIEKYATLDDKLLPGLLTNLMDTDDPSRFIDTVVGYLNLKLEDHQKILSTVDVYDRVVVFHEIMKREIEVMSIEKEIDDEVKQKLDKVQKEYYLKEQLKVIRKELGDAQDEAGMAESYVEKIKEKDLPEEVREKALKEANKLESLNSQSPDYALLINYLDWILDLPWKESSEKEVDVSYARKVLNKEHYGLKSVKERILEFIAVRKLAKDNLKDFYSTVNCKIPWKRICQNEPWWSDRRI